MEGKDEGRLTEAAVLGCEGALGFIVDRLCERDDREELRGGPGSTWGRKRARRVWMAG